MVAEGGTKKAVGKNGTVGSTLKSDTRDSRFEYHYWQNCQIYFCLLQRKDENRYKEAEKGTVKMKLMSY